MKRVAIVLFLVLFSLLLCGDAEIFLFGGVNFGSIAYNEEVTVNKSARTGVNLGVDFVATNFKGGIGYNQFGSNFKINGYHASDTYNYISLYGSFCYRFQQFRLFGGIQAGKALEGSAKISGSSFSISADTFNFDFGILAGMDIMFAPKLGLKATYFHGLTDVIKDLPQGAINYKNRGVGLCLLVRVQ